MESYAKAELRNHFNFEIKKRLVMEDKSNVFKVWSAHSTITKAEFISALEWVCSDTLNAQGKMTREIGLTPTSIVYLTRVYNAEGGCAFYMNGQLWDGAVWERPAQTVKEKKMFGNMPIVERHKISLSCKDKV